MPNSRNARFVFTGMCQTCRPMRPIRPSSSATMSGPPARPSFTGCGKTGEGDRHRAERNAERDADEERNEVRFVQFLERIADGARGFVEIGRGADDLELVAELQPQPRHGCHLDVRARHPCHRDVKTLVEVQFVHRLAEHVAIGDDHAAKRDARVRRA